MRRFLSPAQRRTLDRSDYFIERGKSGRCWYLFRPDCAGWVWQLRRWKDLLLPCRLGLYVSAVDRLGWHPLGERVPPSDHILGTLLYLRAAERMTTNTACHSATSEGDWRCAPLYRAARRYIAAERRNRAGKSKGRRCA